MPRIRLLMGTLTFIPDGTKDGVPVTFQKGDVFDCPLDVYEQVAHIPHKFLVEPDPDPVPDAEALEVNGYGEGYDPTLTLAGKVRTSQQKLFGTQRR